MLNCHIIRLISQTKMAFYFVPSYNAKCEEIIPDCLHIKAYVYLYVERKFKTKTQANTKACFSV